MKILLFIFLITVLFGGSSRALNTWSGNFTGYSSAADDDAFKTMKEICNENGFDLEEYTVTTQDGYILTMFRIPGLMNETKPYAKKSPVLLQHGLEADSVQWVINSPDKAPAFNLASQGFDVWMGNNRGSRYSVNHTTMNSTQPEFWDFDYEDMGVSDLPAEIDFILNATGFSKLSYIGHSEGTTQMFIGLSLKYDYFKSKVNLYVALAPVANLGHTTSSLFRELSSQLSLVEFVAVDLLGMYNMFAPSWIEEEVTADFCSILPEICVTFLEMIADTDVSVDNLDRIRSYLTHMPSGAGYRNLVHYGQIINANRFQRYDYGTILNYEKYGQSTPPLYPLENILDFPIALLSGSLDELADPTDVALLTTQLGKNVVFAKEYNLGHMTFAIGKDMSFFQVDTIDLIRKYSQ